MHFRSILWSVLLNSCLVVTALEYGICYIFFTHTVKHLIENGLPTCIEILMSVLSWWFLSDDFITTE